jgi:hypothetical protein
MPHQIFYFILFLKKKQKRRKEEEICGRPPPMVWFGHSSIFLFSFFGFFKNKICDESILGKKKLE